MKKLLTMTMITLAAVAAKADLFLYWNVDASGFDAAYAALYSGETAITAITVGSSTRTNVGDFTEYWVKLYDSSLQEIAASSTVTYSELAGMNISPVWDSTLTGAPSTTPYTFSAFTIPEPTSGLMLLLGLAGLALKRSRLR